MSSLSSSSSVSLANQTLGPTNGACLEHDHELLRPQLIGTWMPNGVGSMPGRRVIFAETQVSGNCNERSYVECTMFILDGDGRQSNRYASRLKVELLYSRRLLPRLETFKLCARLFGPGAQVA